MINNKIILILPLFFTLSFSEEIEIINPFTDPSVILSTQDTSGYSQNIDSQIENRDKILIPFNKPSVTVEDNTMLKNESPPLSTDSIEIINPFKKYSTSDSSKISSENQQIDLYSTPTETSDNIYDRYEKQETPSYLRATNQDVIDAKALPKSPDENLYSNTPAPDIQGNYRFIEGTRDYGSNLKTVRDAYLVIEKLDDKNFGYYYTYTLDKTTPYTSYGIFNYDKNRFNQRVITDEKFKTSNMDNVKITTDGNKLRMIFDVNGGTLNTLWESDMEGESFLSSNIKKSLDSAKKDYIDIYKKRFPKLTY